MNIKERLKKATKVFRKKATEATEEVVVAVKEMKEDIGQKIEDSAAERALKKYNKELLNDPIPAIMSPRYHFYSGFMFAMVIVALAMVLMFVEVA